MSGIKVIESGAFSGCSSLTTFNIGVEKLEKEYGDTWSYYLGDGNGSLPYGYASTYFLRHFIRFGLS